MRLLNIKTILILVASFCFLNGYGQISSIIMADKSYEKKQYIPAIEYYTKALEKSDIDKKTRNVITYKIADCYRLVNNPKKAKPFYQKLVKNKYSEEKPEVLLYYATVLNMLGSYPEALPVFNQFLKKDPGNKLALSGKATSELGINDKSSNRKWVVKNIKELNSPFDDFSAIYGDNKFSTIIFSSNRKGTVGKGSDNWTNGYFSDLFIASKTKNGLWIDIKLLDDKEKINTASNEGTAVFDTNYKTLYFSRCDKMSKDKMYCQILQSERSGKDWTKSVVAYSDPSANVGHPAISSNGLEMIFSSNRPGGFGGKDLWKVTRKSEKEPFGNPINLGPKVNTTGDELFPSLHNDTILYFASNGMTGFGGLDIYSVDITKNGKISNLEHLPRPINSQDDDFAMNFEPKSEKGFFNSRRAGGKGGDDIYSFERIDIKISIKGLVTDELSKQPMPNLQFRYTTGSKDTLNLTTDANGSFLIAGGKVKPQSLYTLLFSKNDYFTKTEQVLIGSPQNDTTYQVKLSLTRIPDKPIVLPDIYFEVGKWDLQTQYQDSLMVLVDILKDNPKLVIELSSHTDSRASDEYNDNLSQKRAETVVNFITEEGIQRERLVPKGYGKRKPRKLSTAITKDGYTFPAGIVLTEEYILSIKDLKKREAAYLLNRRTEFSVINKNFK